MMDQQQAQSQLKPPRKPLTPYMRFSKQIWATVKGQNPELSVCQIGATIGRMWREMADDQKQRYNEDFAKDKIRYDEDLQDYLKVTGLQASDLVKPKNKKKDQMKRNAEAANLNSSANTQMPMMVPPGYMTNQMTFSASDAANNAAAQGGLPGFQQLWGGALPYIGQPQALQGAVVPNSVNGGTYYHILPQQQQQQQQSVQASQESPMYTNSPQTAPPASSPSLGSASPASVTVQSAQQPTDQQSHFQHLQNLAPPPSYEQTSQQMSATAESTTAIWGWHTPNATYATPDLGAHAETQVVTQHNMTPSEQHQHQLNQLAANEYKSHSLPSEEDAKTESSEPRTSPHAHQESPHQISPSQEAKPEEHAAAPPPYTTGNMEQSTLPTYPAAGTEAAPLPSYPSAHNVYNSYASYQWGSNIPGQNPLSGLANTGEEKPVATKEAILETEVHHLRSALTEKTKEVQRLTLELEKAYDTIESLRQTRVDNGGNHVQQVINSVANGGPGGEVLHAPKAE